MCKCGHSYVSHFMSREECVVRINVFIDKKPGKDFFVTPDRVDRCPCKQFEPVAD
jgi:hypothetical protein